jgi:hypothetical protein
VAAPAARTCRVAMIRRELPDEAVRRASLHDLQSPGAAADRSRDCHWAFEAGRGGAVRRVAGLAQQKRRVRVARSSVTARASRTLVPSRQAALLHWASVRCQTASGSIPAPVPNRPPSKDAFLTLAEVLCCGHLTKIRAGFLGGHGVRPSPYGWPMAVAGFLRYRLPRWSAT